MSKKIKIDPSQLPMNSDGKVIKRYIGKRGYILKKQYYHQEIIQSIKEKLMVKPNVNIDYAGVPDAFPVYRESPFKLYIPKFYGLKNIGPVEKNILPEGIDIELELSENFETRPNQDLPIKVALDSLQTIGGGILALGTGYGKTNIALFLIKTLKKKALIIVHKEFLMNQWKERILQFLPNARVGTIQGQGNVDIEDKDIVIGMLQSIAGINYALDTFDSFGITVIDECHRIPCQHFSKALLKVNSKMMLGLSATPKREDGLTKVLKWYIGDIIYEGINEDIKGVEIKRYLIQSDDEKYQKEIMNQRYAPMMPKMISNIVEYDIRNQFLISLVNDAIEEGRKILILSDRRLHLDVLKEMIEKEEICTTGFYIGGMKQSSLKESEEKDVILGTFSMAAEGMDIPSLNTLILASPKSKIIQAVGRIIRKKHLNLSPLVIDVVDKFSIFNSQGNKRLIFYKKMGYPIENYSVHLTEEEITISFQNKIEAQNKSKKTKGVNKMQPSFGFSNKSMPPLDA